MGPGSFGDAYGQLRSGDAGTGFSGNYDEYFGHTVDLEAVTYLMTVSGEPQNARD